MRKVLAVAAACIGFLLVVSGPGLAMFGLLIMSSMGGISASSAGSGSGSSTWDESSVPSAYRAAILRAGSVCEGIPPQLIAAQIQQESGFDPSASSGAGAQGIAQFMPQTWEAVGLDGDGDGIADVWDPDDAIWTEGHYMCDQLAQIKGYIEAGDISGNPIDLTLAAYNAGLGAVLAAGGVPDYRETKDYIAAIRTAMAQFTTETPQTGGVTAAQQSASALVDTSPVNGAMFPAEEMSVADPTPGAHGTALITPRMATLITTVSQNYPQIVNGALYCWDSHPYNPSSDHPRGRACDIPFYGCTSADPDRAADPSTGLYAGTAAANWMAENASVYGISYIIWNGMIWEASTGQWQAYDGAGGLYDPTSCSGGHYDHIHVSVF